MEEDDHDELLQYTDDDSLSDSDDQCVPSDKQETSYNCTQAYMKHGKLEFFAFQLSLILSSTFLIILFPLYLETINVKSDAYTMIFITTLLTTIILLLFFIFLKYFCPKYKNLKFLKPLITWKKIVPVSLLYTLSGFMIVYAVDRKRVMCHLQDPIKGIILVFALLYYFFFCRKLMGLQRIFSTTTIIVGLFICVDYGLCDEFRCRGREREHRSDDAGQWIWQTHSIWTTVYVLGFSLFTAHITLLDRNLLIQSEQEYVNMGLPSSLLSTVSRRVSFPNSNFAINSLLVGQGLSTDALQVQKSYSAVHLALCLHLINFFVIIFFFWTDMIPFIGKGADLADFLNYTTNGIVCHFSFVSLTSTNTCSNIALLSWLFLIVYIIFIISMLRFLILSQSAVYTVAVMASSLPLVGIWWSLFNVTNFNNGSIEWAPSVTGELICALLGLPIVLIGLCLLFKSHFKDCHIPKQVGQIVCNSDIA